MKRTVKRIVITSAILVGMAIIVSLIYLVGFISATKKMSPAETSAINDSVWCIKDKFVNAYLFRGKTGYILVDAGFGKKSFSKELQKLEIDPGNIKTILLTHTDGDHIGAVGIFSNPAIYMHHDEEQMINGTTGKTKFFKSKWKYGPYILLNSNDTLTIDGLRIKIIHTPGHTPGSSCYVIGNEYLLTGDNLAVKEGEYFHFIEKFNMDTPRQNESLKLLPAPGQFKYILTGHDGIVITEMK
jgi:glyoxylase-like metal-dependent hydrolase (beta-lactamase superfamily II)